VKRPHNVFISYATVAKLDAEWAKEFALSLRRYDDFNVWLDDVAIAPGQDWEDVVGKALRESDVVVALLNNELSPNVLFEMGAAATLGKELVTVVPNKDFNLGSALLNVHDVKLLMRESPADVAETLATVVCKN
jgi:hypothetical protein